jgi:hypothetical protein
MPAASVYRNAWMPASELPVVSALPTIAPVALRPRASLYEPPLSVPRSRGTPACQRTAWPTSELSVDAVPTTTPAALIARAVVTGLPAGAASAVMPVASVKMKARVPVGPTDQPTTSPSWLMPIATLA